MQVLSCKSFEFQPVAKGVAKIKSKGGGGMGSFQFLTTAAALLAAGEVVLTLSVQAG